MNLDSNVPHQYESEKMTITVSELVCQHNEFETYQTIEDQILEMNTTVYELKEVKNTEIGRLIRTQNSGLADHIIDFNDVKMYAKYITLPKNIKI